jgi:hypothetical protein
MGPTALLPLPRKACWGFFRPKNLTASAVHEPVNLGTKGQHATSRPPKPLVHLVAFIVRNLTWRTVTWMSTSKRYFTKIMYAFIPYDISAPCCLANVWQTSDSLETYNVFIVCLTALPTQRDLESDLPKFSICKSCVWMLSWTSSSDNRAVAISSNCGPLWSKE